MLLAGVVAVITIGAPASASAEPCTVELLAPCADPGAPTPTTVAPTPPTPPTTATPRPEPTPAEAAAQLLSLVNGERTRAGLAPLTARGDVTEIAMGWSDAMGRAGGLSHNDAYFTSETRRRLGAGLLGENVAFAATVEAAHQALMASEHHRANILDARFSVVGMGAARRDGTWWLTQDFLQPAAGSTAPERSPAAEEPHAQPSAPATASAPVTAPAPARAAIEEADETALPEAPDADDAPEVLAASPARPVRANLLTSATLRPVTVARSGEERGDAALAAGLLIVSALGLLAMASRRRTAA